MARKSKIHDGWITAELMHKHPETISVFVRNRMACPGCPMAPFDTLDYVMRAYGLDPAKFLGQLRKAIRAKELPRRRISPKRKPSA